MTDRDRWDWYPPSHPLPADGIRARSRRGAIGETWWSQQFIEVLESFDLGTRLTRGKRYARQGQVLELDVAPGEVTAVVQGSRAKPYEVSIRVLPISEKDWARVEDAMTARARFAAKLLAGDMPTDIEDAFADCRLSLFPASAADVVTDCTCPDWSNPCKHVAATYYLLAERFDDDPFLVLRWRGRHRDTLLENLRARWGGTPGPAGEPGLGPVAAPPLADSIEGFWETGESLTDPIRPRASSRPDAILQELDDPTVEVRETPLADVLRPAYEEVAAAAEARALPIEVPPASD